ncbi:MAG: histidine--tRNA ligase [Spirochaetia bacterium]
MSSKKQTQPRIVKGFRDILPQQALQREMAMQRLQHLFRQYGYQPIDTPTLEYADVLLSKSAGETEKQIFRFEDAGGRDVAMRFDLTVPFARFLAMHRHEVGLPFRRYHIGKAWRGENPQRGRYREFYQCDFDIVGSNSVQADIDILLLVYDSMKTLGIEKFHIHINHRQIFSQLFEIWGIEDQYQNVLGLLDKVFKVGPEKTYTDLQQLLPQHAQQLWPLVQSTENSQDIIKKLSSEFEAHKTTSSALMHLQEIFDVMQELGLAGCFLFNPCVTRGLDYYTGVVFETFLADMTEIGSVCSGGRYDNLVGLYTNENISGIGGSIGLDRLLAAFENHPHILQCPHRLDILLMYTPKITSQRRLQRILIESGYRVTCFPEEKKIEHQYRYAESMGAKIAIFLDKEGGCTVRNLVGRENINCQDMLEILNVIKEILC